MEEELSVVSASQNEYIPDDAIMMDNESYYSNSISNAGKIRRIQDKLNKLDKRYHKLKYVGNKKKGVKSFSVEYFSSSNIIGSCIREAISGNKTNHIVGTFDENLYFKVHFTSDGCGKTGFTAFYDSPEQYERHNKVTVSKEVKEKWVEKSRIRL